MLPDWEDGFRGTSLHCSGASTSPAEKRVKIAVECFQEAMHVEHVIDIRRLFGLLYWRPVERVDFGAIAVNDRSDECLRAAVRTADRKNPQFTLTLNDPSVIERVVLFADGTLFEYREDGTSNVKLIRFH
jgi:hypothetical protein